MNFDREQCKKRNRIAARREGVDAVPVRLLRSAPTQTEEPQLLYAHGTLPKSDEEALERINALLPEDTDKLTLDQVYIHYLEAASGNFIPDRFMFMDESTLRNIAKDGAAGVAFMNSHRTGGLSHPSELPFGRTFAGRYEQYKTTEGAGDPVRRSLLGMYMLRGIQPNGQSGPSTDDLHSMIDARTVFDVSVGLYGGERVCDVCGNGLYEYDEEEHKYKCPHAPGTTRKMKPEEMDSQKGRGVPKGVASYSLVGARMGEVSAVFDGAVPGAGFKKTLALARGGELTPGEMRQARFAYARFTNRGDFGMDEDVITEAAESAVERVLRRFGFNKPAEQRPTLPAPAADFQPGSDPEKEALAAKLKASEDRNAQFIKEQATQNAEAFAERLIGEKQNKLPYQRADIVALHRQIGLWQQQNPVKLQNYAGVECSPTTLLETLLSSGEPHRLTQNLFDAGIPAGSRVLPSSGAMTSDEEIAAFAASVADYQKQRNGKGA